MTQLTIRGFDADLEAEIRELARVKGISLNRAALELMRRGAGLTRDTGVPTHLIGTALDAFMGTWSAEEAAEFDRAVAFLDVVDEELWQ